MEKPVVSNADNSVDPLRIPSISDRLRNRTPRNNASNNDDSDDDKPLHLMVNESPKSRPSRHSARYSDENVIPSSSNPPTSSTRSARNQKRLCYNEDTDEDEIPQPKRQATQGRYVWSRNILNFFSIYCMSFFKLIFFFNFGPNHSTTWNSSGTGNPRRDPNSSNHLEEEDSSNEDFDDDDDENGEEQISISSRGRVRKISSKVRGYFRE